MRSDSYLSRHYQSGFTLIEVLVSTLVITAGLLGVASLQITSLKSSHHAYVKTQARFLAHGLIERMRANTKAVQNGDYLIPSNYNCSTAPSKDCSSTSNTCSSSELAKFDVHNAVCGYSVGNSTVVNGGVETELPNGDLIVICPNSSDCSKGVRITLKWDEVVQGSEDTSDSTYSTAVSRRNLILNVSI
jgi:type IV pilus assembly protein PilV